jgi:hypothetical protein
MVSPLNWPHPLRRLPPTKSPQSAVAGFCRPVVALDGTISFHIWFVDYSPETIAMQGRRGWRCEAPSTAGFRFCVSHARDK